MKKIVMLARNIRYNAIPKAFPVVALAAGTLAGAQTVGSSPSDLGAQAISGLNLGDMVRAGGGGVGQIIKDNSTNIIVAMIPIMGFYFLQARVRGLFG